mmetsp:Transcript_5604/g.7360  ORF Transcript_5604/g.7360 Transcript_5604/m.7360 type:complete len:284 (-) Transcript_5604:635-1486(-)|eukprot:CAMPEP_0184010418 /NCGR_PEP_ID=MMETSP0954-20121128/3199_1 /TAXON_ID=627963 /ORGANISM="Aplanochytrium sp, Strain PBS07" /LENGTH=283 /DNA_ID=CAMNT_0026289999 /DNA_START=33 /DNA_END=884 /DNA_ORIENTATION=-
MSAAIEQRNQDATVYVGNLDEKVTDELVWELFLQCGPVANVHLPKDKVTGLHQGYGFVEFRHEHDSDYSMKIMNMIKVFGKSIKVNKASQNVKMLDIGANIFIGNLEESVDEKLLYDTFSAFGGITKTPKVMRDPETGISKGFGFVNFDSFEASDLAIQCMNGQFLANKQIVVQYAYKKESQGERHGSQAERLLAAEMQSKPPTFRPHTMFSAANMSGSDVPMPPMPPMSGMPPPPMGMPPPMSGMPPPPMMSMPQPPMMGMPPPPMPGMPSGGGSFPPPTYQ